MQRSLTKDLIEWKSDPLRMPLLIRGARQVGKTHLVMSFGEKHFDDCLTINFEQQPEYKACFDQLLPETILHRLAVISNHEIIPGKTLLFLDEIQDCPQAITALRYFKEQMPTLHVIAAGSLLEFTLKKSGFKMPVGRVQSLYLKPLSFKEFLQAMGKKILLAHIEQATLETPLDEVLHQKLLAVLHEYLILGGMPAVIQRALHDNNFIKCQQIQAGLMNTYRQDFGKYANLNEQNFLQLTFDKIPGLVARDFKYVHISPDIQSRYFKKALGQLSDAGLIHHVYHTNASGLPFATQVKENKFKLLFLDVGLVKYATKLDAELMMQKDLMLLDRGIIAEQFVGQELLAYATTYDRAQLYYWVRDAKSASSEVDYVINIDSMIIPVEVKAGKTGRLKSLQIFLEEKNVHLGIRICQQPLSFDKNILSVPLYMVGELGRLVRGLRQTPLRNKVE